MRRFSWPSRRWESSAIRRGGGKAADAHESVSRGTSDAPLNPRCAPPKGRQIVRAPRLTDDAARPAYNGTLQVEPSRRVLILAGTQPGNVMEATLAYALPTSSTARVARRRLVAVIALFVLGAGGLSVVLLAATDLRRKQTAMAPLQNLLPVVRRQCPTGPGPGLRASAASPALSAPRAPDITWVEGAFVEPSAPPAGRVLVAYSEEFSRPIGSNGRAVLIFERPDWRVEWATRDEFRKLAGESAAINGTPESTP